MNANRIGRRSSYAALAVALAAGLSACGEGGKGSAAAGRVATTAQATPTPTEADRGAVTFAATDGEPVHGVLTTAGAHAPALVLIHQADGGAEQWALLAPILRKAGFTTLVYDGRGGLDAGDLAKEAGGALRFLSARPDVDPDRLGLVGASIGATTALLTAAGDEGRRVRAAVALSPVADAAIDELQATGDYRPRNVLLIADQQEFPVARAAARGAVGSRAVRSELPGHGIELAYADEYRKAVVRWLNRHVADPA